MKAVTLLDALARKLGTQSQKKLAAALGVTDQTLINWKRRNAALKPSSVANAIVKARKAAINAAQDETIRPLAELYRIKKIRSARKKKWEIFDTGEHAKVYARGLKDVLETAHGIYIFYDSRGQALYVGKAKGQSLWVRLF